MVAILWVLSLCVYSIGYYALNYTQVSVHDAIFQLLILATTTKSPSCGYSDVTLTASTIGLVRHNMKVVGLELNQCQCVAIVNKAVYFRLFYATKV